MRRLLSILCMFSLVHALVGCTSFKPPPTHPAEDPGYNAPHKVMAGVDNDAPTPLVLLPGDTVSVRSASAEVTQYDGLLVDSEGKLHVPVVGAVRVAGVTPQQAERVIEGLLQKYDKFARVSVLVSAWGGHFATTIGAVVTEGAKPITPGMRIADLIAAAGGPLRTTQGEVTYVADLEAARLVRAGKEVPVSILQALRGDTRHNILVQAGDQLFVPPGLGNRIAVLGDDGRAGTMLIYRPGIRLTEALASGGGVGSFSTDMSDIRIIRGPLKGPTVYQYDLDKLIAGKTGDVELAPGDVVFVSRHWSATMTEVISKVTPVLGLALGAFSTYLLFESLQAQRQTASNTAN